MNTAAWIAACVMAFGAGGCLGIIFGVNAMGRWVRRGGQP